MRVLEEMDDMGRWKPFDLASFLKEPEGEYTVELRVREKKSRPKKKAAKR